jgi:hypothetical protein
MKSKWFVGFALLVVLVYGWAAEGPGGVLVTKEPQDFYGFLTDAFLAGQTYLKVAPDPALQNLANPWAGAQGVPRLHDASYFHGRYYIYFGPAPVLLLLLPWRVVTGTFLAQNVATAVFGAAGTLAAGLLLLWAWRRWFSALRPLWLVLGLLLMAFTTRVLVQVEDASVYQVPITCAFFCLMAALGAATWALLRPPGRAGLPLALASVAWGLTVASRPDYAFSGAALAIPVAYLGWRDQRGKGHFFRLALAAFLPAALIGLALAGYNYTRFGDPTQFGMKYQFTAGDQRFLKFFSPESVGGNLRRYFLSRPAYTTYFPFLVTGENWGLLFCTPFCLFAAALPLTLGPRGRAERPAWTAWSLTLAAALLPNILFLNLLAIANERYFVDFVPLTMLLSVVSAWGLLRSIPQGARLGRRLAQAVCGALALWTIGQGSLMALRSYGHPDSLRPLARATDRVVAAVEDRRGVAHGPMLLRIQFPDRPAGTREPLLVTGHGGDILYVDYLAAGQVRLGFFHIGSGGPTSAPLAVVPGRPYNLRVDLGSLYPPPDHPLLAAWPAPLADLLLHRLEVALAGRTVLHGAQVFYPSDPGDIQIGKNPHGLIAPGRFTGKITSIVREGVPSAASLQGPPGEGPVRLVVRFPAFQNFVREPLISTGHAGAGDLLYVVYVAPGVIRFGHDSWGGGGLETAPLSFAPDEPQVVEADLASLRPMDAAHKTGTLALRFNGRLVMLAQRPFNASPATEVVFGFNGCNSGTAAATFTGEIIHANRIGSIGPPPPLGASAGPVELVLRFPEDHTGFSQPLLATGRPGAGDLILVRYLDNRRLSLGYTHPGGATLITRPIAVDYGSTHVIDLSLGSLYPAAGDAAWGTVPDLRRLQALQTVQVTLDGRPALLADQVAQPADPREIAAAQNAISAPDCEPAFTGVLYLQQRLPLGAALPPDVQDGMGPIQLTLRFPTGRPGRNDPLLVTGRTGAGDVVYVQYVDDRHIRIGYDHWNVGGPLSAPIAVDFSADHTIELSLGSLYPAQGAPAWGSVPPARQSQLLGHVSVKLDGRPVISLAQVAYRAAASEIAAAANPIGASTCDPAFTGELVEERRLDPGASDR